MFCYDKIYSISFCYDRKRIARYFSLFKTATWYTLNLKRNLKGYAFFVDKSFAEKTCFIQLITILKIFEKKSKKFYKIT